MLEPLSIFICFLTWTIGLGALFFPWNKRSTLCEKIRGAWVIGFIVLLTIILLWNRFWGVALLPYFIFPISFAGIINLIYSCRKAKLKIEKEDFVWLVVIFITVLIGLVPLFVEAGYVGTQDCGDSVFSIKPAIQMIDYPIEIVKKIVPEVKLRFLSRSLLATVSAGTFQSPVITYYSLMLILFATFINAFWHCGRKWLRYPAPVIAIAAFWLSLHSGLHWVNQSQFLPQRCGEILFLIAVMAWLGSLQVHSKKLVLLSAISMAMLFITFRVLFLPGLLMFLIIGGISVIVNKKREYLLWMAKILLVSSIIGFIISFPDSYDFVKNFVSKYFGHYTAVAHNTLGGNFKQFLFPVDATGLLFGLRWMPYPFDALSNVTASIEKLMISFMAILLIFALINYSRKVIRWGINVVIIIFGCIIFYTGYVHYNYALMKATLLLAPYALLLTTAYLWKLSKTSLQAKKIIYFFWAFILILLLMTSYKQIQYSVNARLHFGYKAYSEFKNKKISQETYFVHLWDGERQAEIMLRGLLFKNIFSNTYQVSGYNWKNTIESTNTIVISYRNPDDIISYSNGVSVDAYGFEVRKKYGNLMFSDANKSGCPETDTLCFDDGWLYLFFHKRRVNNDASLRFYSVKGGKYKFLLNGFFKSNVKGILSTKLNGENVFEKNLSQNMIINTKLKMLPGWNKIELSMKGKNIPEKTLKVTKIEITKD